MSSRPPTTSLVLFQCGDPRLVQSKKPEKKVDYEKLSKEEAFKCFKKMLTDQGVTATWRWEDARRIVQGEERARALRTIHEQKQAFNEYVSEYKQRERQEARQKKSHVLRCGVTRTIAEGAIYPDAAGGSRPQFPGQILRCMWRAGINRVDR